jgi:uncharacterized membrane protein YedE/YeeE
MIKKILRGLMWFVIIFIVSYGVIGIPFVLLTPGTNQEKREAALAFRDAYIVFFAIGALILAIIGTVTAVLPGTKKKPRAKKKSSTEKKARKKK